MEDSDTVVRHQNAFLEYLKPLESVLSRFYFYFYRKKLKNTTNIEFFYKYHEDGISTGVVDGVAGVVSGVYTGVANGVGTTPGLPLRGSAKH